MKSPYACNIETVQQDTYTYEDGSNTFHQLKFVEKKTYVDCMQTECAVWVNGRCNYNQGLNG